MPDTSGEKKIPTVIQFNVLYNYLEGKFSFSLPIKTDYIRGGREKQSLLPSGQACHRELLCKGLISKGGGAWFGPTDSSWILTDRPKTGPILVIQHRQTPVGTKTRPGAQVRIFSVSGDPALRLS